MADSTHPVVLHYGGAGLRERIEQALDQVGLDPSRLTTRDLAPVDEFHSRGRLATRELADLASPGPGDRVLDVGAGIGGPARYLAERFGCRVLGVDLTPAFCEVGNWLCRATGLDGRVELRVGSATALPLEDASFDIAWTIQMQMNVEDKARLYREIYRVLRPGGRYVLQELARGEGGECHLPTPWASRPELSHLVSPDTLRGAVESAGFTPVSWRDTTEEALAWYAQQNAKSSRSPSPLGIHLVMGEHAAAKRRNVERNYREGRLHQVMGAFERS